MKIKIELNSVISYRRASKDPDALMEIKTLLTSLGRNSNPMLTIYASVLREEALKKQKNSPEVCFLFVSYFSFVFLLFVDHL